MTVDLKTATPDATLPADGFLFGADSQAAAAPSIYTVAAVKAGLVGGASGNLQFNASGTFGGMSGTSWDDTNRSLTITGATVTASKPLIAATQIWNGGAGVTHDALTIDVADTSSGASSRLINLLVGSVSKFYVTKTGSVTATAAIFGTAYQNVGGGGGAVTSSGLSAAASAAINFSSTANAAGTPDAGFKRTAAKIVGLTDGSTGGGAFELQEMTAPSAPAANKVILYAEDNGAGKTRLMALFPTGVAQQIAIEP